MFAAIVEILYSVNRLRSRWLILTGSEWKRSYTGESLVSDQLEEIR